MEIITQDEKIKSKRRFFVFFAIAVLILGLFTIENATRASKKQLENGAVSGISVSEENNVPPESEIINSNENNQENNNPAEDTLPAKANTEKNSESSQNSSTSTKKNHKHTSKKSHKKKKVASEAAVVLDYELIIDTGKKKYDFQGQATEGINAFEMLKEESQKENFSLSYQDSSMGAFIESIDGVKNDSQTSHYWMFYVNGKLSDVGASSYEVKDGDAIKWNYEYVSW